MTEFTVKEVTLFIESSLFWMKCSAKHNFSGIDEMRNITNSTNLDWQMYFQHGMINFDYSYFDIISTPFLVHMKLL